MKNKIIETIEKENAKAVRGFAKKIITMGGIVESAVYKSMEPYIIFSIFGTRYSFSSQEKNVFANAMLETNDFSVIWEDDSREVSENMEAITEFILGKKFSYKKSQWFKGFTDHIVKMKNKYGLTPIMEQLACDVAWDMTDGWDEMEIDVVLDYFVHDEEFIKALQVGEKEMRKELDGQIDFDDKDEVCEISNGYVGTVEEEFKKLITSQD